MLKKILSILLIIFIFNNVLLICVNATEIKDGNNEYTIIIEDDADILTQEQEQMLKEYLIELNISGNIIFKTTNNVNNLNSLKYIQNYYYSKFENKSGVAFYIDMYNRQLCACATGGLDNIITNSKCNTIMDNVYTFATKGKYYECTIETFNQMNRLLNNQKIAETMKYACNAILSIMISSFISYGFIMISSNNKKSSQKEIIDECDYSLEHSKVEVIKTGTHKVYSPISSSSGGSSSGGSSSGGGSSGGGRRRRLFRKRWKSWILIRILGK